MLDLKFDSLQENIHQPIRFYYAGTEQCTPSQSWGPGLRDHYKLLYIHSGRGVYETANKSYTLTAGQGFLISPDHLAYYQADHQDPWRFSWVAFNGEDVPSYLHEAGLSADHPLFYCEQDTDISLCIHHLYIANQPSPSRSLKLTSALYAFLALILDCTNTTASTKPAHSLKDQYVSQAIAYIETNYSRSMTIEELAASLGLNRTYFTSIFASVTGMPPQQYIYRYRLNKACHLLRTTTLSIKEIAYSVGYSDQLLFSRMFKKVYQISPTLYRERRFIG